MGEGKLTYEVFASIAVRDADHECAEESDRTAVGSFDTIEEAKGFIASMKAFSLPDD